MYTDAMISFVSARDARIRAAMALVNSYEGDTGKSGEWIILGALGALILAAFTMSVSLFVAAIIAVFGCGLFLFGFCELLLVGKIFSIANAQGFATIDATNPSFIKQMEANKAEGVREDWSSDTF